MSPLGNNLLRQAVPGTAIRTLAKPFGRLATAFLASKDGLVLHDTPHLHYVFGKTFAVQYGIILTLYTRNCSMDFYRPPTTQGILDALHAICRAVRAWKFYPKGHPARRSSLELAHKEMLQLLDGQNLQLVCSRTGFSFPDGELIKDSSGLSATLAFELFVRRIQKITFFHDLFQEDLLEFLKLLCIIPEEIHQNGGIDTVMAERGIRSICINEFDFATIHKKRQQIEKSGISPQGIDESESGDVAAPEMGLNSPEPDAVSPENKLQSLLSKLTTCADDDTYLILTRQAVSLAEALSVQNRPHLILPLFELLSEHSEDAARGTSIQVTAQSALDHMLLLNNILTLLLESAGEDEGVSKKSLHAALKAGGDKAIVAAIELTGSTSNLKTRKTITTLLASLGESAVPALLSMINDYRWFIVRNICAILGAIASCSALAELAKCLHHPDIRVKKEAIRSLAQIGGHDAEAALIGVLRGNDIELYPQAISSLGGMKSRKSLIELMKIVRSKDMFLKSLNLKIDALAAMALIGDRQVTPMLVEILGERHLLAAERGKKLKTAVAICLGKLGDPRAIAPLKKLISVGGELGSVCSDAIALIESNREY